jgi:uncharacterized membrane protein YphA (DoxX/SURF4 family)
MASANTRSASPPRASLPRARLPRLLRAPGLDPHASFHSPLSLQGEGVGGEGRRATVHPIVILLVAMLAPAVAWAHERWVPNSLRFPINRAYFQSMTGEVLIFSVGAAATVFGVILLWYLSAPSIVDRLTPVTPSARAREGQRNIISRGARLLVRLALDGEVEGRFMRWGLRAAAFFFSKVPVFVLCLGAYQGWLVMPSYPLPRGDLGDALRITEVVLALWIAMGFFLRPVGVIMLLIYVYLWFGYGIAAVDAIPVLASAFFYLFRPRDRRVPMNARQLMGVRLSLGVGFFLLGLINKIYLSEIFIGVGDQHPQIVMGPQAMFPGLTREAWSFTTAVGEMIFGLLLLIGVFNRITTLLLTFVFANFIFVFGWAEVVHIYPIAGFLLLFFRGPLGTSLDGLVFRANVRFWHGLRNTSARVVYGSAVMTVAMGTALGLMLTPLILITEVIPAMAGTQVPSDYKPPPPAPPASAWHRIPAPTASASASAVPHGDHTPRYGGVVTMVGDNHVEIVVRREGTVLLYVSDAVRRAIPAREVKGTIRIERPGLKQTLPVEPDASGALVSVGPAATVRTEYTYFLQIRGVPASMTLAVPPGGTSEIGRPRPGGGTGAK